MDENTSFVIDASSVVSFLLPDETTESITEIFQKYKNGRVRLISTVLLPFEVLNGLKVALLRKRIESDVINEVAKTFFDLEIPLEKIDYLSALSLAIKTNLSYYDAAYLQLSQGTHLPLLTLDKKLKTLAR